MVYSTFDSNESMYAKVKLVGGEGYDVVVPSTYYVAKMREEGLLAPLDSKKLHNFHNLNAQVLDREHDRGNKYSIPYLWGGTGLLYDSREAVETPISWKSLWDTHYQGKILLQDDVRDVFGIALLCTGHSINSRSEAEIQDAYALLKTLAPGVLVYNSDSPKIPFLNEEVSIGGIWNGEAYMVQEESEYFNFIWPQEGGLLWMDNFVILQGARNYENALKFIDFMLRPEIAALCCTEYGYPTPNTEAIKLLAADIANNPVIFPPEEVLKRSEFQGDVGESIVIYEKYWEMLRAGQ